MIAPLPQFKSGQDERIAAYDGPPAPVVEQADAGVFKTLRINPVKAGHLPQLRLMISVDRIDGSDVSELRGKTDHIRDRFRITRRVLFQICDQVAGHEDDVRLFISACFQQIPVAGSVLRHMKV